MQGNTIQRAIEYLASLPRGITRSTIELAEEIGVSTQTLRAVSTHKPLAPYRYSFNATSGIRWGSPTTIEELASTTLYAPQLVATTSTEPVEQPVVGDMTVPEVPSTPSVSTEVDTPPTPGLADAFFPLSIAQQAQQVLKDECEGKGTTVRTDDEEEDEAEPILSKLELAQTTIKKLEKDNKKLRLRLADRTETASIIAGAVTPIVVPTLVLPRKTAKSRATFCVALADIHAGEVVDPAQMGGANAYNWEIAQAGMRDIIQRMVSWADTQRGGYDITDCQLWVLGDVTAGSIHESQHLEFPMPVASAKAGMLLAETYGTLAQHFNLNVVQISGNHDRLSQHQPFKSVNRDSLAYPSFVIAAEAVKNIPHVHVDTPEDPIPVIEVNGRWIAAMHGHQIRSSGASPYYGMARRANALLRERIDRNLPKLDTVLLGHFHHFAILESAQVVLCPSLLGPNEWSRQQGFQGVAAQLAFMVGDRGPFSWTPFERRAA